MSRLNRTCFPLGEGGSARAAGAGSSNRQQGSSKRLIVRPSGGGGGGGRRQSFCHSMRGVRSCQFTAGTGGPGPTPGYNAGGIAGRRRLTKGSHKAEGYH